MNVSDHIRETDETRYLNEDAVQLEIAESPEVELTRIFKENSHIFEAITEDLINRKENIVMNKINGKLTIYDAWNDYNIRDFESNEELIFLFNDLGFLSILESDEFIEFGKYGDFGIVYKKKDPIYYT